MAVYLNFMLEFNADLGGLCRAVVENTSSRVRM